jgi:hypothetical protein
MNLIRLIIGFLAANWRFFALSLLSTVFFFAFFFPFGDLSDLLTSAVARATGNQLYIQADTLDLHLIPQPAISASRLRLETSMPPLEAKWARITPGLFSTLFNIRTFMKAGSGDPQASRAAMSKVSLSVAAEDLLGGDLELFLGPGRKSEQGHERSRITLEVMKLDLAAVQRWSEISFRMQGQANLETEMQLAFDFSEQPEGEFNLKINKFALPASTVSIPMGEDASFPLNVPQLTLAFVNLRGRLVGGTLVIEEGTFGQAPDPISGRIKGQIGLRLQPVGSGVVPLFGSYNLTVDLNTNAAIQKDLGFAFLPLDSAKTVTSGGGAKYLFRAMGQGVGMAYVPQITRLNSF